MKYIYILITDMHIDFLRFFVVILVVLLTELIFIFSRVRKCPSNKLMVVYGKVGKNPDGSPRTMIAMHGGVKFIVPFIQSYQYIDLNPYNLDINDLNLKTKDNNIISFESKMAFAVSVMPGIKENAAERLLGLPREEIEELSKDILFGQVRLYFSEVEIQEQSILNQDLILEGLVKNINQELSKIGIQLISIRINNITIK
ncbi:MAG: SPFH domain-containing protein [Candidatus Izemoplasmatales bacterium]